MALGTRCPCMNKGLDKMTSRGPLQSHLFHDFVMHGGFFPYIVLITCRTVLDTSNCSLELIGNTLTRDNFLKNSYSNEHTVCLSF